MAGVADFCAGCGRAVGVCDALCPWNRVREVEARAEAAEKALPESARKHAERVAALEKVAKAARILSNLMPPDSCDGIDEVQAYEILVAHLTALDKLEER